MNHSRRHDLSFPARNGHAGAPRPREAAPLERGVKEGAATTMRHGLGLQDVVAREAALRDRRQALRFFATVAAAVALGCVAVVALGGGGPWAVLLAASPVAASLVALCAEAAATLQLGRARLVLAALERGGPRGPDAAEAEPPRARLECDPA